MGYLVARVRGVDLQRQGSGNIGATNVLRTAGWAPAIATLAGDIVKGYVGVWVGGHAGQPWVALTVVLVVVGNCWSVFLGGKGGKGVATGLGAFLRLAPWALIPAVLVWLALVLSFRYVSLASICAVLGLPVAILALGYPGPAVAAGAAVAVIVVWRHRENIRRLLAGTERRFGEKDEPRKTPAGPRAASGASRPVR